MGSQVPCIWEKTCACLRARQMLIHTSVTQRVRIFTHIKYISYSQANSIRQGDVRWCYALRETRETVCSYFHTHTRTSARLPFTSGTLFSWAKPKCTCKYRLMRWRVYAQRVDESERIHVTCVDRLNQVENPGMNTQLGVI